MQGKIKYAFSARLWQHPSPGGWYFISLPEEMSGEIRQNLGWQEEGWGRLRAEAQIGEIKWATAIWFDTKISTYLLPVKAGIRKQAGLTTDRDYEIFLWI